MKNTDMPAPNKESEDYLQKRKIPELFQSLTIALLYNKPQDHVDYLIKCLDDIKQSPSRQLTWDCFLPEERNQNQNTTPLANVRGTMNPGTRQ